MMKMTGESGRQVIGRGDNNLDETNVSRTDEDFQAFCEIVYNPRGVELAEPHSYQANVTVQILDVFTCGGVVHEIQKLKRDKTCGADGISPGMV